MINLKYSEIIEVVQNLKYEDKIKLKEHLNNYLNDERREEIYKNFKKSKKKFKTGKTKYHKTPNELKMAIKKHIIKFY